MTTAEMDGVWGMLQERGWRVCDLARAAGVTTRATQQAVGGAPVMGHVARRLELALGISQPVFTRLTRAKPVVPARRVRRSGKERCWRQPVALRYYLRWVAWVAAMYAAVEDYCMRPSGQATRVPNERWSWALMNGLEKLVGGRWIRQDMGSAVAVRGLRRAPGIVLAKDTRTKGVVQVVVTPGEWARVETAALRQAR